MAMNDSQKLAFVHKMTHLALSHVQPPQHLDAGGAVLGGPTTLVNNASDPTRGIAGSVSGFLGTNNNFQAGSAPIQAGTNAPQLNNAYAGAQGALDQAGTVANTVLPGVAQGVGSQGTLTNELTAETMGGGPNPAQAALNQNTGTNVANQAALMASQRGAGANPALVAREAAMQGAGIQQAAVGQEATQEAQQQLNAQNELQALAGTQVNQGVSGTQLTNQAQQGEQSILQGANTSANNADVTMQGNINTTNAAVAEGNQKQSNNILGDIGSVVNSVGGAIPGISALFAAAKGGKVPMPKHLHGMASIYHPHMVGSMSKDVGPMLKSGGMVPGKPKVDHDAYKNDTVDAKLTPGETVIDLDTMKRKDKLGVAARFVAANLARKKMGRKL